ncbi:MAG: nucleoside deaminase [Dehalococcoidia bacterium]
MALDHADFMRLAIDEAARGGAEGNSAVGSVIVRENAVVAAGRNLVTTTHDPTAHAETVALREAGAALGQSDLSGCTLYTTFQPCPMCCGALMVSGIATLVMGARPEPSDNRYGAYTVETFLEFTRWGSRMEVVTGILVEECLKVRREWEARNTGGR